MQRAEGKQATNVNLIAGLEGQLKSLAKGIARVTSTVSRLEEKLTGKVPGTIVTRGADEADRIEADLTRFRASAAEARQRLNQKQLYLEQLLIRIAESQKKRERSKVTAQSGFSINSARC